MWPYLYGVYRRRRSGLRIGDRVRVINKWYSSHPDVALIIGITTNYDFVVSFDNGTWMKFWAHDLTKEARHG